MLSSCFQSKASLTDILALSGVNVVPTRQRCQRNETHARGVLAGIFKASGPDHLRLVLDCVTADPANRSALWSETIGAASDAILFRPYTDPEALVSAFAALDLRRHRERAVRMRPWPVRGTLRSFIDQDLDRLITTPELRSSKRNAHV